MTPNIDRKGRIARAVSGVLCLLAALLCFCLNWPESASIRWIAIVILIGFGLFQMFEAKKGWCIARACGLKTPM